MKQFDSNVYMRKISVVIPVYNAENYIEECINSVLRQTYHDWELILVDDGSTDNSGLFCDKIAKNDDRIKVIHQENAGVTCARENGVFASTGAFIYFLDADDTIDSDTLALNWLEYAEGLLKHCFWFACMKLYRRELFDTYVFDIPRYFRTGEDFLMQLRTLKNIKGRILCDTMPKYHYREVVTSASRSFVPTMEYEINMMQQVNNIISSLCPSERLSRAHLNFQLSWLGGMIGFQYPISFNASWVINLLAESKKYNLSLREKIIVKSVDVPFLRSLLVAEKKLRRFYRIHIRKYRELFRLIDKL